MAMNPMQRKIRNSFLFGFLVAVIIAAIAIGFLFMQIKGLKVEMQKKAEEAKLNTKKVYAVTKDVGANENIEVKPIDVISSYVPEDAITEIGEEFMDDEGNINLVALVPLKANTIITSNLVSATENVASYRTVEFNSIALPSKVEQGDYIDIRFQIVDSIDSLDYVVLSKVYVEECTATTIWLKLTDAQLQLLDCAIVESYAIKGSRLYATQFTTELEPKIAETYVPTEQVTAFIKSNKKLSEEDEKIADRYQVDADNAAQYQKMSVRDTIEQLIGTDEESREEAVEAVRSGLQKEQTAIRAAREALMGEDY